MARSDSMPTYDLIEVDELPDNAPSGRANLYLGLFAKVMSTPNKWMQVGYFKTPTGARNAAKGIERGERPIPEGNWEVETRRVTNPNDPAGPKHSVLYAKYLDAEDKQGGDE